MTHNRHLILLAATVLLAAVARAQDEATRFSDPLEGYSIVLPEEAERKIIPPEQRQAGHLVHWGVSDPKTKELTWALVVRRAVANTVKTNFKDWLTSGIAESIEAEKGIKLSSSRIIAVDGRPALLFAGSWNIINEQDAETGSADQPDMLFREMWIQMPKEKADERTPTAEPSTEFLVLQLAVPPTRNIDQIWAGFIRGIRITDPTKALEIFQRNVVNASEVIAKIQARKTLSDVLPAEPQWFLIRHGSDVVGWMQLDGGPENRQPQMDWSVCTYAYSKLSPKEPVRLETRSMFVEKTFQAERWVTRMQIGSGQTSMIMTERGLRQADHIFVEAHLGNDVRTHNEKLTPLVQGIYLSRLPSRILPKFLDLTQPKSYVFAEYTSTIDEFVMRTFTVVGPANTTVNGRSVRAIKAIDQPNYNADRQVLYLDAKGNVLRVEMPGGYVREAVPKATILRYFPKAAGIANAMRKAER